MALVPCQVLRVAILLSYCSILCNYKAIEMPSHQTYGGSWKFLTFIDLVIQAVFFGICVLTDLSSLLTRGSGNQEQERQLKKLISLRDWMLAVLAFPVGVFVVAVFWIIYAYDREMIYPKLLDNFIPGWLNHGMSGISAATCLVSWPAQVSTDRRVKPGFPTLKARILPLNSHCSLASCCGVSSNSWHPHVCQSRTVLHRVFSG
ncbi:androgen-induced gene 1 protein isoform X5 [Elephas maximus indicus]|uniref:androgen-induced gene 1 protein isoform X5 n=1 Tax=Elephas maximus indicus TaxID=99487 RepID=UPI002116BC4E|nr:androgen-induced gene 1 protein isoform X5 [Elephas maximus indicus]